MNGTVVSKKSKAQILVKTEILKAIILKQSQINIHFSEEDHVSYSSLRASYQQPESWDLQNSGIYLQHQFSKTTLSTKIGVFPSFFLSNDVITYYCHYWYNFVFKPKFKIRFIGNFNKLHISWNNSRVFSCIYLTIVGEVWEKDVETFSRDRFECKKAGVGMLGRLDLVVWSWRK